jgi:RNA polymerase sigma-70 factor (ECF subfamily)
MTEDDSPDKRFRTLMRAAQSGDAASYTQLLEEITPRLRRVARRYQGSRGSDEIEDLVQDVLLAVHVVRATYDPSRPFLPWLLAIARNRLVDGARRHARRAAHEVVVDDLDVTFSDESANTSEQPFSDQDVLRAAIETLPPGQRKAIEMLKLRDMSLKDAAAASGTSVGALKVATHRAMQALRKALAKTP